MAWWGGQPVHRQSAEARRKGSSAALSCLFLLCTKVLSASHSVAEFFLIMSATPWTVACQTPLSVGFSRQEYGGGCHVLLQGIFLTQRSNPHLLHCRQILYKLSYKGSPRFVIPGLYYVRYVPSLLTFCVQCWILFKAFLHLLR